MTEDTELINEVGLSSDDFVKIMLNFAKKQNIKGKTSYGIEISQQSNNSINKEKNKSEEIKSDVLMDYNFYWH